MGETADFVYLIAAMPWTCIGGNTSSQSQENCRAIVFIFYLQSAEVENQMTSVERIFEYAQLESEVVVTKEPKGFDAKAWPSAGQITFSDVHLRYFEDMPEVLCGIDCTVNAKEKIGIVGRTGVRAFCL